jgi:ubiquinone/menaquinone biosynthesis C-methylase UbiE
MKVAHRQRLAMYRLFVENSVASERDTILDVGATSDQTYSASNYIELWYPHKSNITAVGLDDASHLEAQFPGIKFVKGDGTDLPFEDKSFDVAHSSAVLEHVGSKESQARLILECTRVARKSVCLTTPNRWFPIEVHTSIPFLHWLPKPVFRRLLRNSKLDFFSHEENLNLLTERGLLSLANEISDWDWRVQKVRLAGVTSNLVLIGHRHAG